MVRKPVPIVLLTVCLCLGIGTSVSADPLTVTISFTAADLFEQVYVAGADGSTAADNALFDGARLLRVGTNGNHADAGRTYVASQHSNFQTRWNQYAQDGYVFTSFNLWGLDGRGANWGEDYKPYSWISASAPTGWEVVWYEWPSSWGTPPAGAYTTLFPGFYATSLSNAIPLLNPTGLDSLLFQVTIMFETSDAWWGQTIPNDPPNDLSSGLTMWFGGWVEKYSSEEKYSTWDPDDYHLYEGNMYARVPEPATLTLLGLGMLLVASAAKKKAHS